MSERIRDVQFTARVETTKATYTHRTDNVAELARWYAGLLADLIDEDVTTTDRIFDAERPDA